MTDVDPTMANMRWQQPVLPEPVPTDVQALADLISTRPEPRDRQGRNLFTALVAQEGHEQAARLHDAACREVDLAAEQDIQQQALADQIGAARGAIEQAQRAVAALTGPAWHVEYAEGSGAADITAFLADAGRALRAADALLPRGQ